ncbi:hypothetical protein CVT26_002723 [Gymnopilus dilepis]|uniref:Uncharacterized protein n=1 Tax=Gymnopilus dilepis TaxID=231916 RepID=A0A409Y3A4_9AGAR|nr:hypothetical protein CVT26_002723 [Gymnopilus dilepis]
MSPKAGPSSHKTTNDISHLQVAITEPSRLDQDLSPEVSKFPLVWPNLEEFERWKAKEEKDNLIEFLSSRNYSHWVHRSSNRPDTVYYETQTLYFCSRHTYYKAKQDGGKKVKGGCPCRLVVRTYPGTNEVRAKYKSNHSHEIGQANAPFTRFRGRNKIVPRTTTRMTSSRSGQGREPNDWMKEQEVHGIIKRDESVPKGSFGVARESPSGPQAPQVSLPPISTILDKLRDEHPKFPFLASYVQRPATLASQCSSDSCDCSGSIARWRGSSGNQTAQSYMTTNSLQAQVALRPYVGKSKEYYSGPYAVTEAPNHNQSLSRWS